MVKELTFDNDQRIGYDNDETIALKMLYANNACLGETMVWSVDFASGEGGGDMPDGTNATSETRGINSTTGLGNHAGAFTYSTDGTCGPASEGTFCAANTMACNGTCCS